MTSRPTNPIAEIFERTANLIEPEGAWIQGEYCGGMSIAQSTCWCVTGAIAKVLDVDGLDGEVWADAHFWPLIKRDYQDNGNLVFSGTVDWNDSPYRTKSEVVSKLREAASLARKGVGV